MSKELLGTLAPRADHRRPTLPELVAVGVEDDGERGWGACVNQKSAEKCRSGFQNQRKKGEKRAKNHPIDDTLARSLPHKRHLEMNNPAKTKEITKKKK
jgi:hypothetical protein